MRVTWTHVATIRDPGTGTVLYVNRNNAVPPQYSTKVGSEKQGNFSPFINPKVETGVSVPAIDESLLKLGALAKRAHEWILEDAAKFCKKDTGRKDGIHGRL